MTPDEVRMLDNRYALLFVRGERAVQDDKYDILKHPNIALTVDGGAARYIHGIAPHAFDLEEIILDANFDDYEILVNWKIKFQLHYTSDWNLLLQG